VKFIVDAQLPPSLAAALRQAGYDAAAVREIGLREAKDAAIWNYALASHRQCHQPGVVRLVMPQWPSMLARLQAGDRLIEVR
jgi:hypothetical protein